jgi:general secretion pathway protein G
MGEKFGVHRRRAAAAASPRRRRGSRGEAGFTLVELLVVMVILVLLASLVAPRVIGYLGSSRTKTAKVQIESLSTALELFKLDTGRYPSDQEGLNALVERPSEARSWNGPYLQKDRVPEDPWGRPYRYRFPGERGAFEIFTFGADDREGGEGEDQDVANWM